MPKIRSKSRRHFKFIFIMKNFPEILTTANNREAVLDKTRLLLAFKKPIVEKELVSSFKKVNLTFEDYFDQKEKNKHWNRINHTSTRYWVKSADGKDISDEHYAEVEKSLTSILDWIGPVYSSYLQTVNESKFCPLPHVFLIEKSDRLEKNQNQTLKKFGLKEVPEKSKYLTKFRYITLPDTSNANVFHLDKLLGDNIAQLGKISYENMPMIKPYSATVPNDTLWASQWNMTQIDATNAWDISTGSNSVIICVLDDGCELTHQDLQFSEDGINLGTMAPPGSPTGNHGTACAGIVAATFSNNEGVTGLAGNCLIMPVAFDAWTDVEVANGINYATSNSASVISMSFGWDPWDPAIIDPEIQNAFDNDVVMCVATHNYNSSITYPATNPLVMACGASSTDDNRKSPTSPDGENWWGSDFGDLVYDGVTTGVSVVAPGVMIPTTDRLGGDGYVSGDYVMNFNGTSSATPLVAGFAALIRSQYPTLTNVQVRNIIEKTAAKVGTIAYADNPDFPNGTRNQEMGYGRIDAFQGLDFADVMIKDWSGDDGTEPSTPPSNNWWSYSDIVVRITDDNVFNPSDPAQSKNVERGQTNYIYIQVTNNGPQEARNVVVDFRITPYVGLEFAYPDDWNLEDAMHVRPTAITANFATVPSGSTVMAKFSISAAQTDILYGWQYSNPWHPCLLAQVTSDNDYAFTSSDLSYGNLVLRKNNIAQRNLSVIDVLASPTATVLSSPFIAGNRANLEDKFFLVVNRAKLPSGIKAYLSLDDDGSAFPQVQYEPKDSEKGEDVYRSRCKNGEDKMVFLNRTQIKTKLGCCEGIMTLEKGSTLEFCCKKKKINPLEIKGGNLIVRDEKRYIEITGKQLIVELEKEASEIIPMSVQLTFPGDLPVGSQYALSVSQLNSDRKTVGGGDYVYSIKKN